MSSNALATSSSHTLDDDLSATDAMGCTTLDSASLSNSTKTLAPFSMQDIAARALARPRSFYHDTVEQQHGDDERETRLPTRPWADRDETTHCPDSPQSSTASSPWSSAPGSPVTQPSSCALTPSSSSEGFTLGDKSFHRAVASTSTTRSDRSFTSPRPAPLPPTQTPATTLSKVISPAPQPRRAPTADDWTPVDFNLKLLFTQPNGGSSPSASSKTQHDDHSLPPAFFPSQRISFSPRLRITSAEGLPVAALGGMHLGVTGMLEALDETTGEIKSKRVIVDFCIDLTSGLSIWRKDARAASQRAGRLPQPEGEETLPPGTYVLPLSMKIPNSDRL